MVSKIALTCAAALIPLGAAQAGATSIDADGGTGPELVTAAVATASAAEDEGGPIAESESSEGWQFAATPYLWVAGVSGDVELAEGEGVDVDTNFTDILSDLKFAFMGAFEARNDRFVLLSDIIYLSLKTETTGPLGFVDAEVDSATFLGTVLAGYRVIDEGPLFLDVFAGGRVAALDIDVELSGPQQTVQRDRSKTSIAPVVAARFRAPLSNRWGFAVYGDLGGFGATADMTWQLMGTVQYDLSDHWRLAAGYRHVAISHDKGDFDVDLAMSGPILGFSYRF